VGECDQGRNFEGFTEIRRGSRIPEISRRIESQSLKKGYLGDQEGVGKGIYISGAYSELYVAVFEGSRDGQEKSSYVIPF